MSDFRIRFDQSLLLSLNKCLIIQWFPKGVHWTPMGPWSISRGSTDWGFMKLTKHNYTITFPGPKIFSKLWWNFKLRFLIMIEFEIELWKFNKPNFFLKSSKNYLQFRYFFDKITTSYYDWGGKILFWNSFGISWNGLSK